MYACMHQFEHFAELVIMKTRQAEQLCMFNVYPLCFNSIYKTPESSKNSKKNNPAAAAATYILLSNFDKRNCNIN